MKAWIEWSSSESPASIHGYETPKGWAQLGIDGAWYFKASNSRSMHTDYIWLRYDCLSICGGIMDSLFLNNLISMHREPRSQQFRKDLSAEDTSIIHHFLLAKCNQKALSLVQKHLLFKMRTQLYTELCATIKSVIFGCILNLVHRARTVGERNAFNL